MPPVDRAPSTLNGDGGGSVSLGRLLGAFLKIGSIGFGGGMAVIALMEREFVHKRRLVSVDEFVHGVGLGQILGPFAVNTSIFLGYRLYGVLGGLLSAFAFLAPSITLVIGLSYLYFQYHAIPALQAVVLGLGPVVIALIAGAAWSIGRTVVRSPKAGAIAVAAAAAGMAKTNAVWVLLAAGVAGWFLFRQKGDAANLPSEKTSGSSPLAGIAPIALVPFGHLANVFVTFLKVGFIFFGGGFVLIPILHHRLVTELRWLSTREFLDGVAISNLTPGPIAVLATFAGYRVAGIGGALAATIALFAPAAVLMLVISHQYTRFRDDRRVMRFLSGVNPAVTGLIASAAVLLGQSALASWRGFLLAGVSLILLVRFRWHPAFVLAIGAAAGFFKVLP